MEALDDERAARWCVARSIEVCREDASRSQHLSFPGEKYCIAIEVPVSAMRSIALARLLLVATLDNEEDAMFEGCLLWLRDWDIGSPELDSVGRKLLEGLRGVSGQHMSIRDAPAHLFGSNELLGAHAALALPLIFDWDTYLVPVSGQYFAFVYHHEILYIVAPTKHKIEHIAKQLSNGQWLPSMSHWPP